jgi:hypothetical protein
MVTDFPQDPQALVVAPSLCKSLRGKPEGEKACEVAKRSPLFDAEDAECSQMAAAKAGGNKTEASRLAQAYRNGHADGGGTCRDEAERILSGASSDPDDGPSRPGDAGAPKSDGKSPAPKP